MRKAHNFSYICSTTAPERRPFGAFFPVFRRGGPLNATTMAKTKEIFTFRDAEKQTGPVAFSTMLKPAGSTCNLDCHYCYYLDKAVQYGGREAVMSDELLERYIRQYIEANDVPTVTFCWHGGEPLLLGIEFYRKALALQAKYADGKRIENTLQTNGTLVDEATSLPRTTSWWGFRSTARRISTTPSAARRAGSRPSAGSCARWRCSARGAWSTTR